MADDRPEADAPRGRVSVRTRIVAVVAVLSALGSITAGVLVYALESARVEGAVISQVEQEIAEFRALQVNGVDPSTGERFDVSGLIRLFLERNVPRDDEMLVGYVDGQVRFTSASPPHPGLVDDRDFLALVARRMGNGGGERLEKPYGDVLVNVVPVRGTTSEGALVIARFLAEEHAELDRVMRTYAIVAGLLLVLVTGGAAWQAGRLLSPLRTLRETADDISESDLSRRIPETGNDDITALTRTFNQMLDRLEAAFHGQRQFLDDAGHELKTPLTVLQGHLELLDRHDPDEVEATRTLLLDEIDRMSRLVNELITLAKTDRPDYYRFADVELAPYFDTLLEKCRALGPRTWVVDEISDQVAQIDEQRITQAMLELAQNAVKHTDEDDEIGLGALVDQRGVRLWVRDTGPGVDDEHKTRIFDRFHRASARVDDEGFGLGLSIVSGIARAHGGMVLVEDAPGGGALFILVLPHRRKDEPWPAS